MKTFAHDIHAKWVFVQAPPNEEDAEAYQAWQQGPPRFELITESIWFAAKQKAAPLLGDRLIFWQFEDEESRALAQKEIEPFDVLEIEAAIKYRRASQDNAR